MSCTFLVVHLSKDEKVASRLADEIVSKYRNSGLPLAVVTNPLSESLSVVKDFVKRLDFGAYVHLQQKDELRPVLQLPLIPSDSYDERVKELRKMINWYISISGGRGYVILGVSGIYIANMILEAFGSKSFFKQEGEYFSIECYDKLTDADLPHVDLDGEHGIA